MADLRADGAALLGFSGTLSAHAAELERRVGLVHAQAGQTLGGSWTGVTADELGGVFDRWMAGAHGVWSALDALSRMAEASAGTYEISEDTLTRAAEAANSVIGKPLGASSLAEPGDSLRPGPGPGRPMPL